MSDVIIIMASEDLGCIAEFGLRVWSKPWPPTKEWLKQLRKEREGKGYAVWPVFGHGDKETTLLDFLDRHLSGMIYDEELRIIEGIRKIEYEYMERGGKKGVATYERGGRKPWHRWQEEDLP